MATGNFTTTRTEPGHFVVMCDGVDTLWSAFSGSHGFSGRNAPNTYGFAYKGKDPVWVGPLATAKAMAIAGAKRMAAGA